MKELADILGDPSSSGVYALQTVSTLSDLGQLAKDKGIAVFHVNGQHVRTKEQFLKVFAEALRFPDYFGFNWDAFEDCLTDLSWHSADGYAIIYDRFDVLAEHSPDEADTAMDVFRDCAEFWCSQEKAFLVLLRGAGEYCPELTAVRH